MKKISTLFCVICAFLIHPASAQLNYTAASGVNTTQTYTDLGVSGTSIAVSNIDDGNSAPQAIGFDFVFNGTTYTQFVLNTNGFIKLGATAPASAGIYDILLSAETNVIAPLNMDLIGNATAEYRVFTSGVAPNRVCTIQFKDVRDFFRAPATAPQFGSMQFQVKLYETTNNIEFVYGTFTAGGAAPTAMGPVAGIKGSDAYSSVNVTKSSTTAWSAATFINRNYTANKHNIRNDVLPIPGQTYRFTTVALTPNDATVLAVYTLGKLPINYGTPHIVQALVKNSGGSTLTNLAVSLNVSGANTFNNVQTVSSLAAGASTLVSFAGFTPTNTGTNTVAASVPADDVNTGNTVAVTQMTTTDTFSYADNNGADGNVGFNTSAGITSVKYNLVGSGSVTNVNVFLFNTANSIGNTVYAVVMNAAGTIVGQSANLVIAAGDLGAYKNFTILTPPALSNTTFYVGLAQTANATTGYFPVGSQSEALPTRSGAYYRGPIAGGVAPTETTSQGRYMIQAIVSTSPLPVKLSDFSGRLNGNTAHLQWTTAFESNSDKFDIERAVAGTDSWVNVGSVKAAGNSAAARAYVFADAGLAPGEWMYRLKSVDKDGQFAYSTIISLKYNGSNLNVLQQNYPNPVKDATRIQYQLGKDATVQFEVYALDGRRMSSVNKGLQTAGSYNLNLNAQALGMSSGKYIYRLLIREKATGEVITLQKEMHVTR